MADNRMEPVQHEVESLSAVVIRFVGDSGLADPAPS